MVFFGSETSLWAGTGKERPRSFLPWIGQIILSFTSMLLLEAPVKYRCWIHLYNNVLTNEQIYGRNDARKEGGLRPGLKTHNSNIGRNSFFSHFSIYKHSHEVCIPWRIQSIRLFSDLYRLLCPYVRLLLGTLSLFSSSMRMCGRNPRDGSSVFNSLYILHLTSTFQDAKGIWSCDGKIGRS